MDAQYLSYGHYNCMENDGTVHFSNRIFIIESSREINILSLTSGKPKVVFILLLALLFQTKVVQLYSGLIVFYWRTWPHYQTSIG